MNHRTPVEGAHASVVGRYLLHQPIARGGMATVHAARLVAAEGVTRLVAAKRLHPQFVDDPEFVAMFHDEARIASRIHHPNVVPVLDVIHDREEVILVQEYVHGVPLSYLLKLALAERRPIALGIALTIVSGVLSGLHAAHEATDDAGEPLGVVHRDVSPQNVLVSVDGIPRLVDFGIAKARTSMHHTREGFLKGKLSYMAPEQLRGEPVTRAADIYAAGVMLWELVVNHRFYDGKNDADFVRSVALGATRRPTEALSEGGGRISPERWAQVYLIEPIINRAMASTPEARFGTAAEMAAALGDIARNAPAAEVAAWVRAVGGEYIEKRQRILLSNEDAGVRPSGAYVRVDAQRGSAATERPTYAERGSAATERPTCSLTLDAHPRPTTIPPARRLAQAVGIDIWPPRSLASARAMLPWALCAVLLVAVCVLAGIALRREPAPPARVAIMTRHVEPTPSAIEIEPIEVPELPAAVEPRAGAAQPPATSQPSGPPAARFAPTPVRGAPPPAPARPAPQPKECNQPLYFDGSRKIYKPSCL